MTEVAGEWRPYPRLPRVYPRSKLKAEQPLGGKGRALIGGAQGLWTPQVFDSK